MEEDLGTARPELNDPPPPYSAHDPLAYRSAIEEWRNNVDSTTLHHCYEPQDHVESTPPSSSNPNPRLWRRTTPGGFIVPLHIKHSLPIFRVRSDKTYNWEDFLTLSQTTTFLQLRHQLRSRLSGYKIFVGWDPPDRDEYEGREISEWLCAVSRRTSLFAKKKRMYVNAGNWREILCGLEAGEVDYLKFIAVVEGSKKREREA